jgi:A/G-specific adenine glycosylase
VPTRATTMLVVRDAQGRVLLERRPPTGVWARLWSFPEVDDAAAAARRLHDRYGILADVEMALDRFVHTFSHYHLQITPLLLHGVPLADRIADAVEYGWHAPSELDALGLPAPVRKLLQALKEEVR